MKNIQIDIIIVLGVIIIWTGITLLMQNKVCADWEKSCLVSPVPTTEIISPTITIRPSCTPTPSLLPSETIIPTSISGTENTPIPTTTATSTPIAGQSATIIQPTSAPDTGRSE
jgi:hypothetical protein